MKFIRHIARPLLASVFIVDAIDALRNPDEHAEKLAPVQGTLDRVHDSVPVIPSNQRTLVRLHAGVTLGAGVLFALGKAPRTCATVLAAAAAPAAVLAHPVKSKQQRQENLSSLLARAAAIAGLTFAAADRQGSPSLGWRYRSWQRQRAEAGQGSSPSQD